MRKEKENDSACELCNYLQSEETLLHSVLDCPERANARENMGPVVITVLMVNLLLQCQRQHFAKGNIKRHD